MTASDGRAPPPETAGVAQYQIRHHGAKGRRDWINCPGEAEFADAMASRLYEGRKLYAQASDETKAAGVSEPVVITGSGANRDG